MSWIQQFSNMLFPINRERLDIEGAFTLKNENIPSSIFKYRAVNTDSIKNLEDDTVWLSDPSRFNDPYDCAHTVDFSRCLNANDSALLKMFMEEKGFGLSISSEQLNALLGGPSFIENLVDAFPSDESLERQASIKAAIVSIQSERFETLARTSAKMISGCFKLCSFSERFDSMLMWAHYSDYHKGFCIEYDIEGIPHSDYRRRFLYPVIYSSEMFDATAHIMKGVTDESFNNLHLSLAGLIKSKEWEYEKEWRLVFANGVLASEQAYSMGKPKRVFLGAKIGLDDQRRLVEICTRKNIPVCKMKTHHRMFKLEPVPLRSADWDVL